MTDVCLFVDWSDEEISDTGEYSSGNEEKESDDVERVEEPEQTEITETDKFLKN